MFENFNNFIYSSKESFPKDKCTIQNKREPDVFDSNKVYLVLWIDVRFPHEKYITYAKPYIWKGKDGEIAFGWTALSSSMIFGNVENSCQFYDEFVIGFIPIDDNYLRKDEEQFDEYKLIIKERQT